jgi:hypothetical protein
MGKLRKISTPLPHNSINPKCARQERVPDHNAGNPHDPMFALSSETACMAKLERRMASTVVKEWKPAK